MTPELILGDMNQDGSVNFSDILAFIRILSFGSFLVEADLNEDGVVSFKETSLFIVFIGG